MTRMSTSTATMLALVVLFVLGAFVGSRLLFAKADVPLADAPTCESRTLQAGDDLTSNLVKVNVYNASVTSGLANRVQINLQLNGFLPGVVLNSPEGLEVDAVTILTDDEDDPSVRLLASQFKDDVDYAELPAGLDDDGVSVVVGSDYSELEEDPQRELEIEEAMNICAPIDQDAELVTE